MKDTFLIHGKDGLATVKGHLVDHIGIDNQNRYKLAEKGHYWHLTHIPTAYGLPGKFKLLRDAKQCAEEIQANINLDYDTPEELIAKSGYNPSDLAVLCKAIARKHKGGDILT